MAEPLKRVRIKHRPEAEDSPDSIIMAEYRAQLPAGSDLALFADMLAADLARHSAKPISRQACAAMARAAANLQAMAILGYEAPEILAVLGFAAAQLELKAPADA